MSFKAFISSTAIAGTLLTVALVAPAPVEAAVIGGSNLGVSTSARLLQDGNDYLLDFFNPKNTIADPGFGRFLVAASSTGTFEPLIPPPLNLNATGRIRDIPLVKTSATTWGVLANATVPALDLIGLPNVIFRVKTSSILLEQVNGTFKLTFNGFFEDSADNTSIAAFGSFTGEDDLLGTNGTEFGGDITAAPIPTPALLPGLIGMGVAALRRKKDETVEENA